MMILSKFSVKNTKLQCYSIGYARLFSTKSSGNSPLLDKILIANRGEIACRVIRTAKRMGIKTVAVFSEADRYAMHAQQADEAYCIGPPQSSQSYLRGDKILQIAKQTNAKGIHPGYGFLSENAKFAASCKEAGVVFIGPPPSAIEAMGSKSASKNIMGKANVPLIPGYHGEDQSLQLLKEEAKKIGYPVLIKAVMGGGGKGMRIVTNEDDFEEALQSAKRESMNSFGDDRVLVEKYITTPRHIEMQVFADTFGNVVHLNERDCSVQRRHQKVLEEAPAPGMTPALRKQMGEAAVNAAKAVGYVGAGTVEFIFDTATNHFYFMEMNTRLQVEHPVSEFITQQDLVEWQLRVASGHKLPLTQDQVPLHGHALEARIYAENPNNNFLPGTGKLVHLSTPHPSKHVRIDTGVREGDTVSVYYDPMIAKLIVWDHDRHAALQRMRLALEEYRIIGLANNVEFLSRVVSHPAFAAGNVETGFIQKYQSELLPPASTVPKNCQLLAALAILQQEKSEEKKLNTNAPFATANGFRLNHNLTRTLSFLDGEKPLDIVVTYNTDGTYDLQLSGSSEPIRCSATLNGADIQAQLGNQLVKSTVVINESKVNVFLGGNAFSLSIPIKDYSGATAAKGSLLSPMPGRIIKVLVDLHQKVKKGQPLMIMEAMKMEHMIRSPVDGIVEKINYKLNDLVEERKQLLTIGENA